MENIIHEGVINFFEKLCVHIESIEIEKENSRVYLIKIKSDDSAIIIGPHGRNLESLQKVLSLVINKSVEERIITHLEVNDYLKTKDERLYSYISSKVNFVIKSGADYKLPSYSAYERKKIHAYVSGLGGEVFTQSRGEGEARRLFLYKNKKHSSSKLSIDIDGDDI